jgi:hypothetical protein
MVLFISERGGGVESSIYNSMVLDEEASGTGIHALHRLVLQAVSVFFFGMDVCTYEDELIWKAGEALSFCFNSFFSTLCLSDACLGVLVFSAVADVVLE